MLSESLTASVGMSNVGCTELTFVELGVKINGTDYREVSLKQHLLSATTAVSGDTFTSSRTLLPALLTPDSRDSRTVRPVSYTHLTLPTNREV